MPEAQSPTVHQRRLRVELRKSRNTAGLTQEQVAAALDWSLSKVIRIEAGAVRISITDLRALLQHYEVPGERVTELVELARAARSRAWWSARRSARRPGPREIEARSRALRQVVDEAGKAGHGRINSGAPGGARDHGVNEQLSAL